MTLRSSDATSACAIIAELGVDISAFQTPAHLISWSELKPRNDESAGKIKSRRITHGNKYLCKTLIECAWAAGRTRDCHFSRFSYHQTVVRRKKKMKVQAASQDASHHMTFVIDHLEGVWYTVPTIADNVFAHQQEAERDRRISKHTEATS